MSQDRGDTHLTQIRTFMVTVFLLQKQKQGVNVDTWRMWTEEKEEIDDIRMSQYCPSWLQINFQAEYVEL